MKREGFVLIHFRLYILFLFIFYCAGGAVKAQVAENISTHQTKTILFQGRIVPQEIFETTLEMRSNILTSDFYKWLAENNLQDRFSKWLDSLKMNKEAISGAAFGQIPPPQKLALNSTGKNIGMDKGTERKNDRNLDIALPPDTTQYYAMAGGKPKSEPKSEPTANENWCESIEIENGRLILKGIQKNGVYYDASTPFDDFLSKYGVPGASTKDIIWQTLRIINGEKKVFFIINKEYLSVLVTTTPDLDKMNDIWGRGLCASDASKIFAHEGSVFVTDSGTVVALTPTTLLAIHSEKNGKRIEIVFDQRFGKGPAFTRPTIRKNTENDVCIYDETMPNQYMIYDLKNNTLGLFNTSTMLDMNI
jgi:hypothetical protein